MTAVAAFGHHLVTLFIDPPRAFRADAAKWAPPLVTLMLLTMSIMALHEHLVPFEDRVDAQIAQTEAVLGHPLSNAQREARLADTPSTAAFVARLALYGGFTALALLVTSLAFTVLAALSGHDARYSTIFAIVADAMVPPSVIWTGCAVAVLLLKPTGDIDPIRIDLVVLANVGAFLDHDAWSPFVVSLGSSLDLFSLWTAALTATGLAIGAPRLGRRAAVVATVLVWGTYVLLKALLAIWIPQLA